MHSGQRAYSHHMVFEMSLSVGIGALCICLLGTWLKRPWLMGLGKTVASLSFVWAASHASTSASYYGTRIVWATRLGLVGDLMLLRRAHSTFLLGLLAFFLGHLCYIDAFLHQGFNATRLGLALLLLLPVGAVVQMWLWPKVDDGLKGYVLAYLIVITLMLAAAAAALQHSVAPGLQLGGAALFYLSDLCVARDSFIIDSRINKLLGLPLYYAAQWLLVTSLGG